jgi:hypothetical protein
MLLLILLTIIVVNAGMCLSIVTRAFPELLQSVC